MSVAAVVKYCGFKWDSLERAVNLRNDVYINLFSDFIESYFYL